MTPDTIIACLTEENESEFCASDIVCVLEAFNVRELENHTPAQPTAFTVMAEIH